MYLKLKMEWCKSKCPDWLIVKKCCFCMPIRKGVIIFGYVNLILSLLSFPLLFFLLVEHLTSTSEQPPDNDNVLVDSIILHLPLTIAFVTVDVIMTVVMIIGAYKKNQLLLKIYFYFAVVFQLITLCVDLIYLDFREYAENFVYFFFLGLNIYLLFLVFNIVHQIEESSEVQYIAYRDHQQRHV